MAGVPVTLAELLLEAPDAAATRPLLDHAALSDLRTRVGGLPEIAWSTAADTVADAILAALDVKLTDILAGAWSTLRELQDYADPARHPAEETALVPLARHKLRSTHHPSIEVMLGEDVIAKLEFTVALTLSLEGIVLKVRGGRIREIASGSYAGTGSLKLADAVLVERQTPSYIIPGSISLGDGIPIPH
jgi:hypothetical protein